MHNDRGLLYRCHPIWSSKCDLVIEPHQHDPHESTGSKVLMTTEFSLSSIICHITANSGLIVLPWRHFLVLRSLCDSQSTYRVAGGELFHYASKTRRLGSSFCYINLRVNLKWSKAIDSIIFFQWLYTWTSFIPLLRNRRVKYFHLLVFLTRTVPAAAGDKILKIFLNEAKYMYFLKIKPSNTIQVYKKESVSCMTVMPDDRHNSITENACLLC